MKMMVLTSLDNTQFMKAPRQEWGISHHSSHNLLLIIVKLSTPCALLLISVTRQQHVQEFSVSFGSSSLFLKSVLLWFQTQHHLCRCQCRSFPWVLCLCCSDPVKICARCFSSHTSLERSVFFHLFLDSRLAKSNGKNSRLSFEQAFVHDHTSFQNSVPCALLAHQFLGTAASVGSASGRPFVNKLGAAPYSKAASTCSS